MSVDVIIRQKGLVKKALTMNDFLGTTFDYGILRSDIMDLHVRTETGFLLYNPKAIARGIDVVYPKGEKKQIQLFLSLFTSDTEVDDFYDLIMHLCTLWNTQIFEQDETSYTLEDIPQLRRNIKNTCIETLETALVEYPDITIFGAFNPISIDEETREKLLETKSLSLVKDYLHTLQSQDVYYARPSFYQGSDGIFGAYVITEDCDSVFPLEPMIPFSILQTNGEIDVVHWYVGMYSLQEERTLGYVEYDAFKEYIGISTLPMYDARNVIVKGLTKDFLQDMLAVCGKVDL